MRNTLSGLNGSRLRSFTLFNPAVAASIWAVSILAVSILMGASALGGAETTNNVDWNTDAARHLLSRVAFGAAPQEAQRLAAMPMKKTARYVGFTPDDAWCYATATNREGIARIHANQPGTWVIKVHHKRPTSGPIHDQYDFDSFTTTLTFEVSGSTLPAADDVD